MCNLTKVREAELLLLQIEEGEKQLGRQQGEGVTLIVACVLERAVGCCRDLELESCSRNASARVLETSEQI